MNNEIQFPQLPFLTREMLKFGNTAKFEIVLTSIASRSINLIVKGITKSGVINIKQTTNPNSHPTSEVSQIDDIPVMIGIETTENILENGEVYISLGLKIDGQIVFNFVSGFITTIKGLSWPNSNLMDTIPGHGFISEEVSPDPIVGGELRLVVPLGEVWLIHSLYTTFVADANVASRKVHIVFTNPGGNIVHSIIAAAIIASQSAKISVAKFGFIGDIEENYVFRAALPHDLWMLPSSVISSETNNLEAGDNYGTMTVLIEKFFTGGSF